MPTKPVDKWPDARVKFELHEHLAKNNIPWPITARKADMIALLEEKGVTYDDVMKAGKMTKESKLKRPLNPSGSSSKPPLPVNTAGETATEKMAGGTAKETVEKPVEKPVEQPVEEMAKETVEDTAKETVEDTAKETVEDTAKETVEDTAKETVEDTAKETVEDTAKETVEDTAKETVEDTAKETVEATVKKPVEETTGKKERGKGKKGGNKGNDGMDETNSNGKPKRRKTPQIKSQFPAESLLRYWFYMDRAIKHIGLEDANIFTVLKAYISDPAAVWKLWDWGKSHGASVEMERGQWQVLELLWREITQTSAPGKQLQPAFQGDPNKMLLPDPQHPHLIICFPSDNPKHKDVLRGGWIDGNKYPDAFKRYVGKGANITLSLANTLTVDNECKPEDFEIMLVLKMPWGKYFRTHALGKPHYADQAPMLYSKVVLSTVWTAREVSDVLECHEKMAGQQPISENAERIITKSWRK
ncbi:hypothetical protein B0H63DRAFT_547222 [Podospora didyma]|uniref:Uncharacterized protein n=1 Tax=Podospora didyma TaxID=330526 RepID=A0AAE0KK20_9PEZI|nr:hypothetical protein B0H63DRAFT_547222 [Podospora didyma]